MPRLAGAFKDPNRQKIAHDAKGLFRSALDAGVEIAGFNCDTKIAAYLLEPGSSSGYELRDTVSRYLGVSLDMEKSEPQAGEQATLSFATDDKQSVCREAVAIRAVAPVVEETTPRARRLGACHHPGVSLDPGARAHGARRHSRRSRLSRIS